MDRLIDDCIIMDYGQILTQCPVSHLINNFYRYEFIAAKPDLLESLHLEKQLYHPSVIRNKVEFHSFLKQEDIELLLLSKGIKHMGLHKENVGLEDAFIGLIGKY